MKKIILFSLILISAYSCIKKKALKYDPQLVGTWVSNQDSSVYSWLIITPDGVGTYATHGNNEEEAVGEVKYSLFERKMWVGKEKFKVLAWRSGKTDGVSSYPAKKYKSLKDTVYVVDEKMTLKTGALGRTVDFFRIKQ